MTALLGAAGATRKRAVLSMDIEEWFHVDYLDRERCDRTYSMLDGLDVYLALLERNGLPSSFFCTGQLATAIAPTLRRIHQAGHDVGSHTHTHRRPLTLSDADFDEELVASKNTLEDVLGAPVCGFRAPCFSLDDRRLERVIRAGYLYDSSRVAFAENPRYGRMDLTGFEAVRPSVFRRGDFFEFELSTQRVLGRNLPVSGGGYLRLLPWWVMRTLIAGYLERSSTYLFYIHPYELSRRAAPVRPGGLGRLLDVRFRAGRATVESKLERLVGMLRRAGFVFTTFSALRAEAMAGHGGAK